MVVISFKEKSPKEVSTSDILLSKTFSHLLFLDESNALIRILFYSVQNSFPTAAVRGFMATILPARFSGLGRSYLKHLNFKEKSRFSVSTFQRISILINLLAMFSDLCLGSD